MALIYKYRVRQKANTIGTGNVFLGNPVPSYITFTQASLGSNSFPYAIINSSQFEVGVGTFDGTYLHRNLVLSNSNLHTNPVNFDGSTGDVIITNSAELSVLTSTQPVSNTKKFVKWVNSEFILTDPIENPQAGIQSSVVYYNNNNGTFNADPNFKFYPGNLPEVYINGVIQATAKSFVIPHPLKQNTQLVHGCLEGPEHAIYLRGTIKFKHKTKIKFPDYFVSLVNENYTVNITSSSFMPITVIKKTDYVEMISLSFKEVVVDYFIVASRNDVPFNLEKDVV